MTDLVAQLVGALEECLDDSRSVLAEMERKYSTNYRQDWLDSQRKTIEAAEAALSAAKDGGWVAVQDCPDGDVWFALSCGHVVMGYKQGDLILDWEAAVDHDCCYDASAIKAMPVVLPNPPKGEV